MVEKGTQMSINLTHEQYAWVSSQSCGKSEYIRRLINMDMEKFDEEMRNENRKNFHNLYTKSIFNHSQNLINNKELEDIVRFIARCIRNEVNMDNAFNQFLNSDKFNLLISEILTSAVEGDGEVVTQLSDSVIEGLGYDLYRDSSIIDRIVKEYYGNVYPEEVRTDLILFLKMYLKEQMIQMKLKG